MSNQQKSHVKAYIYSILITLLVGGLSALLTRNGMKEYADLNLPPLAPPGIVFPIVWTILFVLMGISAAMVYNQSEGADRKKALGIYAAQLVVNFFWSIIFFCFGARLFAMIWLILLLALVFWMYVSFYKIIPAAAYLQIPYILWLCFAAYLNFGVWFLNR